MEKAFLSADVGQLKLVYTALHERSVLMANAPHLTSALATLTPCYKWQDLPYYWAGLKAYDALAGRFVLHMSRFCTASEAKMLFPPLADSMPGTVSLLCCLLACKGVILRKMSHKENT